MPAEGWPTLDFNLKDNLWKLECKIHNTKMHAKYMEDVAPEYSE